MIDGNEEISGGEMGMQTDLCRTEDAVYIFLDSCPFSVLPIVQT